MKRKIGLLFGLLLGLGAFGGVVVSANHVQSHEAPIVAYAEGEDETPEEEKEFKALKDKGFDVGKDGKIFALVTKIRGSRGVGMYSIFEYKGYAGKVVENYSPEAEQQDLPFAPPPEDESDPF